MLTTPGGTPASSSTLHEVHGGQRRQRGWLEHDGVAAHQRRNDLPRRDRHREIPRRDDAADAERLADRHRELVAQLGRHGLAVHAPSLPRHEERHVDRFLDVAARLLEDLPHLARHVARELSPCDRRSAARHGTASPRAAARARAASRRSARSAAAIARTASSGVDSWNTPIRSSWLAGLRFSKSAPEEEADHVPSMKFSKTACAVSFTWMHDLPLCRKAISSRKPIPKSGRAFARSDTHPTHRRDAASNMPSTNGLQLSRPDAQVAYPRGQHAGNLPEFAPRLRVNKVIRSWHES